MMDFIFDIKEETLIIGSDGIKKEILKIHQLLPIKIISLTEFIQKYYFSYDEEAILYLMKKYNMKYDVACNYIDNIYYVTEDKYDDNKLDYLVTLKHELDEHNLLIYHADFREYLRRVKIILYDVSIDSYLQKMLSGLDYQVIERKYRIFEHKIIEFQTMEEEVQYIAYQICQLIDEGTNINKIKLTNVTDDYKNIIERIFTCYNLKVNISYRMSLANYPLVKRFITEYINSDDIEGILTTLDQDDDIYCELIKVINKYLKYQDKDLLIYKLEHTYIYSPKYNNVIEIIDYLDYISHDDEYIFMLGFNDGIIPKSYQDTEYITDNICHMVGLKDTTEKNSYLRERIIKIIGDIKNLTITYKLRDYNHTYYLSTLSTNYEIINDTIPSKISYSEGYDRLKLAIAYDNYFKYGEKTDNFDLLNQNYQIDYHTYSNKFSGIDRVVDKLTLSYSQMQMYNKCAFRYYLTHVLKVDIFEENFSTIIGSMVHYVMEKCLENENRNIEYYVHEFLGERTFSKKENFFLEKYKECIQELLNQVLLEREYSVFNQAMYEKKIDVDLGDNVHFVGIIDKILYYITDDITYVSLIDYKTGMDEISLAYLKYGLNIQLPIYLYLATKLGFRGVEYAGFYLQKFNIINKDYRLVGYSNSNKDIISLFDKNYDDSKIIKGLKTISDGSFAKTSKVLSSDSMNMLTLEVEKIIRNVANKIKKNDFEINPKAVYGKNIGCEYCKFKDICFKTDADEVNIIPSEFGGQK